MSESIAPAPAKSSASVKTVDANQGARTYPKRKRTLTSYYEGDGSDVEDGVALSDINFDIRETKDRTTVFGLDGLMLT